jgi:hypothetical protein
MKSTILPIIIAVNLLGACKSHKETAATTPPAVVAAETNAPVIAPEPTAEIKTDVKTVESNAQDSIAENMFRLTVSFYSTASGAEAPMMRKLEDFVGEFAEKNKTNVDYEKSHWGREGESDYCFKLNELSADKQKDFILQVSDVLKEAKWVHINENQPCMHRKRR